MSKRQVGDSPTRPMQRIPLRGKARHAQRRARRRVSAFGVVLVAVVIMVIVFAMNGDDDASTFSMNGTPLLAFDPDVPDLSVGAQAPIVVATDLSGERIVVGDTGGSTDTGTMIAFFAHWCPTCQAELPALAERLANQPLPAGVELIAVSTFEDLSRDNHPPDAWFESVGWTTPVVADTAEDEVAAAYGAVSIPFWVVLNDIGEVLWRGSVSVDGADFDTIVALAAGGVSAAG